jgi:hypothetical protein
MVLMLAEDRFGLFQVRGLDPDLGLDARYIADTGIQVVA